jgi:hypothetical protein
MKLKAILSAILFILTIGLAGCVDADHYGPRGYPGFAYYDRGPWWGYGPEFHHEGRFDHDRFGEHALGHRFASAGVHGGEFRGGHFGGRGGHR